MRTPQPSIVCTDTLVRTQNQGHGRNLETFRLLLFLQLRLRTLINNSGGLVYSILEDDICGETMMRVAEIEHI